MARDATKVGVLRRGDRGGSINVMMSKRERLGRGNDPPPPASVHFYAAAACTLPSTRLEI